MLLRLLSFFLPLLAGVVIAPLFEPFFQAWLSDHGYYSSPFQSVSAAMNWVENIIGVTAFPWVAGGLCGATLGVWTRNLAAAIDRRFSRLSREEEFGLLQSEMQDLVNDLVEHVRSYTQTGGQPTIDHGLDLRIRSLYKRLSDLKLKPPEFSYINPEEYNFCHSNYIFALLPFARHNQLKLARNETARIMRNFRAQIAARSKPGNETN